MRPCTGGVDPGHMPRQSRVHHNRTPHRVSSLVSRFLVASPPVRDLLLCAKHLFVAARTVSHGCGHHAASATGSASARAINSQVPVMQDDRSCELSADATIAALAPAGWTQSVLWDSRRRPIGAGTWPQCRWRKGTFPASSARRLKSAWRKSWLRKTNVWRKTTTPARGAMRLTNVQSRN